MSIKDLSDNITSIIGALLALSGIIIYFRRICSFLYDIVCIPKRIKNIEYETKFNGGRSIKDIVKRLEENLGILDQKVAFIIDNGAISTLETDRNGQVIKVSLGYCRLVGRTEKENLGNNWINNVHHDQREMILQEWQDCVKNKNTFYFNDLKMIDSNENPFLIDIKSIPIMSVNGEISGWFSIITKS